MSPVSRYALAPGLVLSIEGGAADVRHFDREYGPCRVGDPAAGDSPVSQLQVRFGSSVGADGGGPVVGGGHKTVSWEVGLPAAGEHPARVRIALRGLPASFARSLVQGYFVEPLLSVVAAETGSVLLPAAGIMGDGGLDVLIGRSRAGKSTLAARALAAGRHVPGDDQVMVDATGGWRPFPRRLRFYPDLRETAPRAWAALAPGTRARLRARGVVSELTRGFIRPSLAVDPAELGRRWDPAPARAARILLLERSPGAPDVAIAPSDAGRALDWAAEVLREQRSRLARVADAGWASRLSEVAARERETLGAAIDGVPVLEVRIPEAWGAQRAIAATATALGYGR